MKNLEPKKLAASFLGLVFSASMMLLPQIATVHAQTPPLPADVFGVNLGLDSKNAASNKLGLGVRDPRSTIATVIRAAMGFLGTIAIVIILLGGFKWMTAAGNDEKITEAKKLIASGVIGLVIILSAYAITTFVLNQLITATSTNG